MRRRATVPAGAAARSHGMQLCRQAQQFLSIGMLYHVSKIYIYIVSHGTSGEGERSQPLFSVFKF